MWYDHLYDRRNKNQCIIIFHGFTIVFKAIRGKGVAMGGGQWPRPHLEFQAGLEKTRVFLKKPSGVGFFGFYWVLLGFFGFYWVFLGFIGFLGGFSF